MVMLCDHWTHAALSLYIEIGPSLKRSKTFRSFMMFIMCRIVLVQLSTEPISACAELRAVYVWRLDCHVRGPPNQMTNPAIERLLNSSSNMGSSDSFGTDWSCGPQFVSVKLCSLVGSRGN